MIPSSLNCDMMLINVFPIQKTKKNLMYAYIFFVSLCSKCKMIQNNKELLLLVSGFLIELPNPIDV